MSYLKLLYLSLSRVWEKESEREREKLIKKGRYSSEYEKHTYVTFIHKETKDVRVIRKD